ncbi:type IV pilus biogenesis/stability protein PilW [Shewanella surugensis]|uniref:Type IV pilus biogenesis/stability protein PilW n=1 Tax=Shewanella surugensis TaxID=212020 RepID=A0ABT0LBC7_9GAMM|nr:type IV pilus biogenesis/stability protein PilW [Shewanella surugensis]MCL1125011.1 type IV pilus biogenesis/stability protein PilW [Shewanella surugensis]
MRQGMRQGMRQKWRKGMGGWRILLLISLSLVGCVTQRTYVGTGKPVSDTVFNGLAAAKQRVQLALMYLHKGNNEQAKYNLDKAFLYAPKLEAVNLALAYYHQSVGDKVHTKQAFQDALDADDVSGDSFNNFGVFLCQQGQYTEAEKQFLKAVSELSYTEFSATYENLGICSRKAGKLEKARNYFHKALRYNPRRKTSLLELVEIEVELGDFVAAHEQLTRYYKVLPRTTESLALGSKIGQGLDESVATSTF